MDRRMRKGLNPNLHPFHPNVNASRSLRWGPHPHRKGVSHSTCKSLRRSLVFSPNVHYRTQVSRNPHSFPRNGDSRLTSELVDSCITCLACTPTSPVSYVGDIRVLQQACEPSAAWRGDRHERRIAGSKIMTRENMRWMGVVKFVCGIATRKAPLSNDCRKNARKGVEQCPTSEYS